MQEWPVCLSIAIFARVINLHYRELVLAYYGGTQRPWPGGVTVPTGALNPHGRDHCSDGGTQPPSKGGHCSYRGSQPAWPGQYSYGGTQSAWLGVIGPTGVRNLHDLHEATGGWRLLSYISKSFIICPLHQMSSGWCLGHVAFIADIINA
jgi:hypothetical protein